MSAGTTSPFFDLIRSRLIQLRSRQQWLVAIRSTGIAIVGLVSLAFAACFIESILPSESIGRWLLSGCFYLCGAGILGAAIRPWLRTTKLERTAVEVERRVPDLREQLLATVELASELETNPSISRAFCQALEQRVVSQLDRIDHRRVFPIDSVYRPVTAAGVLLTLWLVVSLLPQSDLWQRLGSVMFPSPTMLETATGKIILIRPQIPAATVPGHEVMLVEAAWSTPAQNAPQLLLEVRDPGKPKTTSTRTMTLRTDASPETPYTPTFMAQWNVDDSDFEYRIIGGNERTEWYQITVLPRPRIEAYRKVVIAPEYAKVEPKEINDTHGNIDAIMGSTARIEIQPNIPLQQAEFRYKTPSGNSWSSKTLFSRDDQANWYHELVIEEDASYQIHLWASGSDFESSFDPTSRIIARNDKPPTIQWLNPTTRHNVARPTATLELKARIDDEFPLQSVTQQYRVNRGTWTPLPVSPKDSSNSVWTWRFDLYSLRLKRGDVLEVQLLALDAKGQTGESQIIEFVLSAAELDASRLPQTLLRESLADLLRDWQTRTHERALALREARDAWQNAPSDTDLQSTLIQQLQHQIEATALDFSSLLTELRAALPQLESGVAIVELDRVLAELGKMEAQQLTPMQAALIRLRGQSNENEMAKRQLVESLVEWVDRYDQSAKHLDERFRKFIVHDVLADLAHDLEAAYTFQSDALNSNSTHVSESWKREQEMLLDHLDKLGRAIEQQSTYLDSNTSQQLRHWSQWTQQITERMLNVMHNFDSDDDNSKERLRNEIEQVRNELRNRRSIQNVQGNYVQEANQARRQLEDSSGRSDEWIRKVADQLLQMESEGISDRAERQAIGRQLEQLTQRRDVQLDSDRFRDSFASDLGMAYRAAVAAVESTELDTNQRHERLNTIADSLRKLEAVHRLTESEALLGEIWEIERWELSESSPRVENPRTWDSFRDWFERSIGFLREAGFDHQAVHALDQLRWSQDANQAQQKIAQRRWEAGEPISAATDIERLRQAIDAAKQGLESEVASVRSKLEDLSPSISELANEAAQESRDAQTLSASAAERSSKLDSWERQQVLNDQSSELRKSSAPVNQLLDALTEITASHSPLSASQMQRSTSAELGRKLVEQSKQQLAESIQKAEQAAEDAFPNAMEALAQKQGEVAKTLEALADHFDRLRDPSASSESIASSLDALASRLSDPESNPVTNPQQAAVERLSRQAQTDPHSLRQWLEQELQQNAPMRSSLAEIAEQLTAEALKNLEHDAQRERSLQSRLEQSDQAFDLRKRFFQDELSHFAEQAHRDSQRLSNEVQAMAVQGRQEEMQHQARQLAQDLADAATSARNLNGQAPLREWQAVAEQLKQSLHQSLPNLDSLKSGLQHGAQQSVYDRDDQRQEAKQQADSVQQRMRDQDMRAADADVQRRERRRQQLEQAKQQFEQQSRQAMEHRDRVRQQLEQQPNADWLQKQLGEAESRVDQMQSLHALASSMSEREEAQLQSARSNRDALAANPNPLEAPNPKAELAGKLAKQSADRLNQIVRGIQDLQEQSGWQNELQADRGSLQESANQQASVMDSLSESAEKLQRASQHLSRLNRPEAAQTLGQLSNRVADTATQEASSALASLQQASQSEAAQGPRQRADPNASNNAQRSLQSAESVIRQRADELAQAIAQTSDSPPNSESQGASESASTPSPLPPKEMAQLLDELDRQLQSPMGIKANILASQLPRSNEPSNAALEAMARKLSSQMTQAAKASNSAPSNSDSRDRSPASAANANSLASSNAEGDRSGSAVRVLTSGEIELAEIGAWNRLREQKAEDVAESQREQISLRYRKQIEAYFRELSKQDPDAEGNH